MPTESGSVSRWNDEKGFGFIVGHDTQDSIYVHRTGLIGVESLCEGDEVQFERFQDAIDVKRGKKERAANVRLMNRGSDGGSSGSSGARQGHVERSHSGAPTNGYHADYASDGLDQSVPRGRGCDREMRPHDYDHGMYRPEDGPATPHVGGRFEVGTVKSWNDEKKFGFILPDRGGDSIYVHCTGLLEGMEYLREGDGVEFERFQDPHDVKRGKERAVNVRLLDDPYRRPISSASSTSYGYSRQEIRAPPPPAPKPLIEVGRVSRWNDEKGFGFIVHHVTQDSIYVHRTGLIGSTTLQEGDEVEYERYQDARDMERGKERCVNVRILHGNGNVPPSGPAYDEDHGYRRGYGDGYGRSDYGYDDHPPLPYPLPPPRGSYPPPEVGTVMSWNDEKGFGFILLHGSKESIYMHRTGIVSPGSIREGDTVEFERTQDQRDMERGKERAVNVRVVPGMGSSGHHDSPHYQNHFHRAASSQDYRGQGYEPMGMSYGQEDSYGFPDRRYSHGVGGQDHYRDAPPYASSHDRERSRAGDKYEIGTVSAWNDDKGFGFIVCDVSRESIYVHRTGLMGIDGLSEGDTVEFGRTQDARDVERGKQRAVNVRILGGGSVNRGRDRSRSPRRR